MNVPASKILYRKYLISDDDYMTGLKLCGYVNEVFLIIGTFGPVDQLFFFLLLFV